MTAVARLASANPNIGALAMKGATAWGNHCRIFAIVRSKMEAEGDVGESEIGNSMVNTRSL